jgi:hypothetical protein
MSLFAGSGAYGIDLASISADVLANNNITLVANANYEAGDPSNAPFLGTTYFGSYSGIFSGNGATISGLTVPLFDYISGTVSDLDLQAAELLGVTGQGILSNSTGTESIITNVSAQGDVTSDFNDVGGLVGFSLGTITGSSTSGTIVSTGSYVGGLAGHSSGLIENSTSSMSVSSSGSYVGGLVGRTGGEVINSSASGNVESTGFGVAGGLIGYADGNSGDPVSISTSHATGSVEGDSQIGGLIGLASGTVSISGSSATSSVVGNTSIGGLLGYAGMFAGSTTISESHASGSVTATGNNVGGLVGNTDGIISISQSYSTNDIFGSASNVGGLVGYFNDGEITDTYTTGNVQGTANIGGVVGTVGQAGSENASIMNVASTGDIQGIEIVGGIVGTYDSAQTLTNVSSFGSVTASDHGAGSLVGVLWNGNINGYRAVGTVEDTDPNNDSDPSDGYNGPSIDRLVACDCRDNTLPSYIENYGQVLAGEIFDSTQYVADADDQNTPPPSQRERVVLEVTETRTAGKIEKTLGFKNDTPLPKDAVISFLQSTDKIDIAKVKSFEITPNAIVRVSTKTEEALQISLKSESKTPVELWVLSTDGKWLLAGVITFDKDGKAILPPLQFKSAGDYSLVFSTPSADSAKASAPFNIGGQVIVSVI